VSWPARRAVYWQTHDRRCARCGSTVDVVLHHLTYRHPLGEEPDEALMPLCRAHHLEVHQLHAKGPHRDLGLLSVRFVRWGPRWSRFLA
jgi:5-methylcytosine-specific restriction endonuclease McrA